MIDQQLKIATFNLWHGLAGRGVVQFREFESVERREQRFQASLRLLLDLEPDILLLQELNPVSKQGLELRRVLGGAFSGRVDQSGIKLFSHGFPRNLATGLGILVRGTARVESPRERHRLLPGFIRLSGSLGFSGERASFHFDEQRYALLEAVRHSSLGRLLVINFHVHHGFERFPALVELLERGVEQGRVSRSEVDKLNAFLDLARARRLGEIDRLLEVVHQAQDDFDGILLGGDLNSTPEGAAYRSLIVDGFKDLALSVSSKTTASRVEDPSGPTWDPIENFENHRIQREVGFDFPLPNFGNSGITTIYREFDAKPRRIDFLFAKGSLASPISSEKKSARISDVRRFGFPASKNALAPSDHFGLMATYE